jgi:hypothetical protein
VRTCARLWLASGGGAADEKVHRTARAHARLMR